MAKYILPKEHFTEKRTYSKWKSRTWLITCYAMALLPLAIIASVIVASHGIIWPWMSYLVPGLLGIMVTYVAGEKLVDSKSVAKELPEIRQ